jgi:hypothetical protein
MIRLVRRCICCFDRKTGELVKEIPFRGITLSDLQKIFGYPANDRMIEVFDILPRHARRLTNFLPEPLDLGSFDYELSCYSIRIYGPESALTESTSQPCVSG